MEPTNLKFIEMNYNMNILLISQKIMHQNKKCLEKEDPAKKEAVINNKALNNNNKKKNPYPK